MCAADDGIGKAKDIRRDDEQEQGIYCCSKNKEFFSGQNPSLPQVTDDAPGVMSRGLDTCLHNIRLSDERSKNNYVVSLVCKLSYILV